MFVRDPDLGRVMDVIMLGPRGVGKTSLLASLYDRFPTVIGDSALSLTVADAVTRNLLQRYREELRRFARGVPRDEGVRGDSGLRHYLLGLGTRRPPQMTLRFTDFPGYLLSSPPTADRATLDALLPGAGVVFVAVDSPAVMEREGLYNDEINQPDHVSAFVEDMWGQQGHKLVVLVPLKCEKYAADPVAMRELSTRIKQHYQRIAQGGSAQVSPRVGVVLTTVQTVGSMHFSRFDTTEHGDLRERFRLRDLRSTYSPQDTDQPLRWMLRFAVNGFMARDKTFGERVRDWWSTTDEQLTAALRKFAAECKEEDGFEILHHHPYLEAP